MSKNKDIILSIGLLVSNRKDTIQKCLDSLAPIREAISTELIIIDTGCDADLHEILEKYADKLECFTWCKDFAKARNASLALATGEWFLYLDDDEWFIDSKAIIDFFRSGKYKDYGSASYIQRNYLDFEGSQYTDTWVGRMTKIEPETCFKSKIHEYIHPRTGADINLNAIVEHYGYVYKTEEDKCKHFERNFTLLKEMVAEEPDEIRWKLQLVQELRTVDAFEDMIAYGKEYLELLAGYEGGYEAYAIGSFYASIILGYMGMEDYENTKQWCDTLRVDARVNKLALTLAEQIRAKALFYLGDYEASITAAKQYFEYQKYFKFHRNELHLSQKVPFVGEVFDVVKIKEMYSLLICSGLKLQDVSYLSEYMHKLKWNEKHLYVFEEIADTLIEAMCTLGYRKAFYRIVKIIRAHSALNEYFYGKVEEWKENGADVTPIENIDKWGIRKRTQKQLLEIVDSLISVNTLIKSLVEMGNKEQLEGILSEAQNVAISLGTAIENGLGLGTVAVGILEQYCEVLWSITQATEDKERQELVTVLVALMEKEKEEISNFPIKTVAVFMPYKASMWDSLESVWLAARDDEMCDDYVVPIPYFDLDTDRQFKKYNYEGELFPEYVPVTFYEDYDVEAEHPDMIYVHNPYDQYNTVTSVAPNYYCSKLKDYTDNLVYIPYFVLEEIKPSNQAKINGMKHFCFLPGTMFADTVILQSEDMRQIYINEFERATKSQGLNIPREALEKKFLGIGSPKFDKVNATHKEDLNIPNQWLNVIEKRDGSWKKVIFYNTSLSAILHNREKMLDKIQSVIDVFYELRDEVVLLWRPHPLIEQTLQSMLPNLQVKYVNMVKSYKEAGWGIYDGSSDLNKSVAISDAYYGDLSSVVQLFKEAGKPVMLQSVTSYLKDEPYTLATECLCDEGQNLWATHVDFNGLFKMDKDTLEPRFIGHIPGEKIVQERLYTDIVQCDDKLYLCPFNAEEIAEYDMRSKAFGKIPFENTKDFSGRCFKACVVGKRVYFIPYFYSSIICYDTEKKDVSYIEINKMIGQRMNVETGYFICCEVYNDKIILPFSCVNALFIIDTKTNETSLIESIGEGAGFVGVHVREDEVYLVTSDGVIIRKSLDSADVGEKLIKSPIIYRQGLQVYPVWGNEKKMYMFPHESGYLIEFDLDTEEIKKSKFVDSKRIQSGFWRTITAISFDNTSRYFCLGNSNYIGCSDGDPRNVKYKKMLLSEGERERIASNVSKDLKCSIVLNEGACMSISNLIECLEKGETYNHGSKIGEEINSLLKVKEVK